MKKAALLARAKASVRNDGSIAENSLINKMMINWAEKQALEDRQGTEDVLDA